MGFRTGAYCGLWEIEHKSPRWAKVKISTSRKDPETGEYETDFTGFVDFFGTACVQKLSRHKNGDRVILGDVEVTTKYDKENDIQYTNFKCFSFNEIEEGDNRSSPPKKSGKSVDDGEIDPDEDDLEGDYPF